MKKNKINAFLLITLLSGGLFLSLLHTSYSLEKEVKAADDVVLVSPTAKAIAATNELSLAKDIDPSLRPTITSTANLINRSTSVADGPKVTLHGDYDWSYLVFTELKNTDTVTVKYPYVGTYKDKPISLTWTFSEFYKAGNTYHNETHPNDPKIELFINQNMYNGYVYRGIESFKLTYDFRYDDGTQVEFDNNAYLGFNSLNGYNDETRFGGIKYKDVPYFANYRNITEGIAYLNKDASSKIYLMDNTNIKQYPLDEVSPSNPASGMVYAGSNNLFEDAIGALTYTKNSISYQLKGNAQTFLIVGSRGSAWNTPSGATLFNTLAHKPEKKVSDSDENLTLLNTLSDLDDGIKNGVTYSISQRIGVLGNDILSQYSEFGFTDTLNEVFDAQNAVVTVKDTTGSDVTNKFNIERNGQAISAKAKGDLLSDISIYDGRTYTMFITVKIDQTKTSMITTSVMDIPNTATVSINNTPQITNQVDTLIQRKPLEIQKIVDKTVVKVGEEIVYTLRINNLETIDQSAIVVDDLANILAFSDYVPESITIDGKNQTDIQDNDVAEFVNQSITARVVVPAKKASTITFKVKTKQATGDKEMINSALLKTKDGDTQSNEVRTKVEAYETILLPDTGNTTEMEKHPLMLSLSVMISSLFYVILKFKKA